MAEDSTAHAWLFPRVLPLNSERLTLRLLQAMAMELGLPTNATKEDLRQMIDGQLNERGKDPLNVQVFLCQQYHQGIKSNQPKPPDSGRKVQRQAEAAVPSRY